MGQSNIKKKTGNPLVLGATKQNGGVNFALECRQWKEGDELAVRIFERKTGNIVEDIPFSPEMKFGSVFAMEVTGFDTRKHDYGFVLNERPLTDPYGKIISNKGNWGEGSKEAYDRYSVLCDRFNWGTGKRPEIPFDETIIYRLHVRGFTKDKSSGTRYKGTYRGVVDKLQYLKNLGINTIELMPVYDFDEVSVPAGNFEMLFTDNRQETFDDSGKAIMAGQAPYAKKKNYINFWGYTTAHYFAPKSSYGTGKKSVVTEFKELVKAVHDNGMNIILDFYFVDGMLKEVILDCLRFWTIEYHIDGIRINLSSVPIDMIKADPVLSDLKIIGDSYSITDNQGETDINPGRFAVADDSFMCVVRKFIKSDEGQTYDMAEKLKDNKIIRINYLSTHNSMSLMDMVSYDRKHNEENGEDNRDGTDYNFSWNCGYEGYTRKHKVQKLRKQQIKNAVMLLMLSQGVPMIMSGDEMGKTRNGNNNPYCQDNEINYIDWNDIKKNREIYDFTRYMIEYRKNHKIFHMDREIRMNDYLSKGCPDLSIHGSEPWRPDFGFSSRGFAFMYNEQYADTDDKLYVAFNMYWENQKFNIPMADKGKKWEVFMTTCSGITKENMINANERVLSVPGRSIVILNQCQDDGSQKKVKSRKNRLST